MYQAPLFGHLTSHHHDQSVRVVTTPLLHVVEKTYSHLHLILYQRVRWMWVALHYTMGPLVLGLAPLDHGLEGVYVCRSEYAYKLCKF